jgi:hypothetical protein
MTTYKKLILIGTLAMAFGILFATNAYTRPGHEVYRQYYDENGEYIDEVQWLTCYGRNPSAKHLSRFWITTSAPCDTGGDPRSTCEKCPTDLVNGGCPVPVQTLCPPWQN